VLTPIIVTQNSVGGSLKAAIETASLVRSAARWLALAIRIRHEQVGRAEDHAERRGSGRREQGESRDRVGWKSGDRLQSRLRRRGIHIGARTWMVSRAESLDDSS
jgi:Ni/Co efflux regulator RcnB